MSNVDRSIRALIGLALIAVAAYVPVVANSTLLSILVGGFGVANILSAAFAFCPPYHLAGLSTHASGCSEAGKADGPPEKSPDPRPGD